MFVHLENTDKTHYQSSFFYATLYKFELTFYFNSACRLIHDRELQLCDGTTLLQHERYDTLLKNGLTKLELSEKDIFRIPKTFRIIAMAEPPSTSGSVQSWMTPEMLSLFLYLEVSPLQRIEEHKLMTELYGNITDNIQKVINLSHILRESSDPTTKNLAETLSTKQLLKIAHRITSYPCDDQNSLNSTYELIQNTFLAQFLPAMPRAALEKAIKKAGIAKRKKQLSEHGDISLKADTLKIGGTEMKVMPTDQESKVPNTLFYEVPQHIQLLERLLQVSTINILNVYYLTVMSTSLENYA